MILKCFPFLVLVAISVARHPAVHARPVDHRDHAYCADVLANGAESGDERFADIDPIKAVIPQLLAYAERDERTLKSLSRDQHLDALVAIRFTHLFGLLTERIEAKGPLGLYEVYAEYLKSHWIQFDHLRRTDAPDFFTDAAGTPSTFAEFRDRRLAALKLEYPRDVDVGPFLRRVYHWLPTDRRNVLSTARDLIQAGAGRSLTVDMILGQDPIAAIQIENATEVIDDRNLLGVGMVRERLYSDYAHLAYLWRQLKLVPGQVVFDPGAGHGRVGLSVRLHAKKVRFIGTELLASRVAEAAQFATDLSLKPAEWRVDQTDVTAPGYDLPRADFIYLTGALMPSQVDTLWTKLGDRARAGEAFTVVMSNIPLFAEAAARWPDEFADYDRLFSPLPSWLKLTAVLNPDPEDFDSNFFVLEANGGARPLE